MKIVATRLYRYELPLHKPLLVYGKTLTRRRGYVLRITSDGGCNGLGDIAAPLDGISTDTDTEVRKEGGLIKDALVGCQFNEKQNVLHEALGDIVDPIRLSPAVCFALETALYHVLAEQQGWALASAFNGSYASKIPVNGFVSDLENGRGRKEAEALMAQGFRTLKLKIGRADMEKEIGIIRKIIDSLPEDGMLRLDANRSLSRQQAIRYLRSIGPEKVEYVEEPTSDIREWEHIAFKTGHRFAVDESLFDHQADELWRRSCVAATVVKPSLMGGWSRLQSLIRRVQMCGKYVVVSSYLESGVGVRALVHLAASMDLTRWAAGVDTLKIFRSDLLHRKLTFDNGCINVNNADMHWDDLKMDCLEELR